MDVLRRQPVWLLLAIASGACAAINGVFAKLTTTSLTTSLATSLSHLLSLPPTPVNLLLRATFFGLNLAFNVAMWTLFTAALTRGDSTTRVSIVNVSSNFVVTAVCGAVVFGEKLPGWWWVGAGCLVVGNVVIGRERGEEGKGKKGVAVVGDGSAVGGPGERGRRERGEREGLLGEEGDGVEGEGDIIDLDGERVGVSDGVEGGDEEEETKTNRSSEDRKQRGAGKTR
ncbi:MAG: hypothetical protein Q9227_002694 [Pyrenula ochraceoflavens]